MGPSGCYERALLKLSGNALADKGAAGIDDDAVRFIARQIAQAHQVCPQLAIVIGGGNILRGAAFRPDGPQRIRADYAGMIATMVNALVLQDGLEQAGVGVVTYGALPVGEVIKPFGEDACRCDLQAGRVVILSGGTGNPLFTTDTGAALRAVQLGCEVMLKATRVDGVYNADPEKDPSAELHDRLSYQDVLTRRLAVMDMCAVSMCREHSLPVQVFNYKVEGNVRRALQGESIGTMIGD